MRDDVLKIIKNARLVRKGQMIPDAVNYEQILHRLNKIKPQEDCSKLDKILRTLQKEKLIHKTIRGYKV